jgi:hypothetical protein
LVRDDRVARAGLASGARLAGRNRLDGLAIGAPVTATFIGVMLAKGELGGAAAGDSEAVIAAHRLAPGEIGAARTTSGDRAPSGPGDELNLEDGAAGSRARSRIGRRARTRSRQSGCAAGRRRHAGAFRRNPER